MDCSAWCNKKRSVPTRVRRGGQAGRSLLYGALIVLLLSPWFALSPVFAAAQDELRYEFTLGTDYSRGRFNWNIAGNLAGSNPNILSELTWYDLDIAQVTAIAQVTIKDRLVLAARGAYGAIVNGKNQDSDYNGDNRTQEFLRSNSKGSGSIGEAGLGVGYHYLMYATWLERYVQVTPMVGYARNLQYLKITDGQQTIPASAPLANLDSSYDAEWSGPWLGVKLKLDAGAYGTVFINTEYHRADYYAEANWNLRGDFVHPVSFKHIAQGSGLVFSLALSHVVTRRWEVLARLGAQFWHADPGTDTLYVIDTTTKQLQPAVTRLNEVNWRSISGGVAETYHF